MVDGNHMLAGQNLNFNVEVVAIREATPEELAHGHVHGADGHHHDHDHDHDHDHGHDHGQVVAVPVVAVAATKFKSACQGHLRVALLSACRGARVDNRLNQ